MESKKDIQIFLSKEVPLEEVTQLFSIREKIAIFKKNLSVHSEEEIIIPNEYVEFLKLGAKIQLSVNSNPALSSKIQKEFLGVFEDGPYLGSGGFTRLGFENDIAEPRTEIHTMLLSGEDKNLKDINAYIDQQIENKDSYLYSRFINYISYEKPKEGHSTGSYAQAILFANQLYTHLNNKSSYSLRNRVLGRSKKSILHIFNDLDYSTLKEKEQIILVRGLKKFVKNPSKDKVKKLFVLYQEMIEEERQEKGNDKVVNNALIDQVESKKGETSIINKIKYLIKNNKITVGFSVLMLLGITLSPGKEKIEELTTDILIGLSQIGEEDQSQYNKIFTGLLNQETHTKELKKYKDLLKKEAYNTIKDREIGDLSYLFSMLDNSIDTLLNNTPKQNQEWKYTSGSFIETFTEKDSIIARERVKELVDNIRPIQKILEHWIQPNDISSFDDYFLKLQTITDGLFFQTTTDPNINKNIRKKQFYNKENPILLDFKREKDDFHTILHEFHHKITKPSKYNWLEEGGTELATQIAIEQEIKRKVDGETYTTEVINAGLLQHCFDFKDFKQINKFTDKAIINNKGKNKHIVDEYISNKDKSTGILLKEYEKTGKGYDALRFKKLIELFDSSGKNEINPVLTMYLLPQQGIDYDSWKTMQADTDYAREYTYNKSFKNWGIEKRSLSTVAWKNINALLKEHDKSKLISIENFQKLSLRKQLKEFDVICKLLVNPQQGEAVGLSISKESTNNSAIDDFENEIIKNSNKRNKEKEELIEKLEDKVENYLIYSRILMMLLYLGLVTYQNHHKYNSKALAIGEYGLTQEIVNFMILVIPFTLITAGLEKDKNNVLSQNIIGTVIFLFCSISAINRFIKTKKRNKIINTKYTLNDNQIINKSFVDIFQKFAEKVMVIIGDLSIIHRQFELKKAVDKINSLEKILNKKVTIKKEDITNAIKNLGISIKLSQRKIDRSGYDRKEVDPGLYNNERIHPSSFYRNDGKIIVLKQGSLNNIEKESMNQKDIFVYLNLDRYVSSILKHERLEYTAGRMESTISTIKKVFLIYAKIAKQYNYTFTIVAFKNNILINHNTISKKQNNINKILKTYIFAFQKNYFSDKLESETLQEKTKEYIDAIIKPMKKPIIINLGKLENSIIPEESISMYNYFEAYQ